MLERKIIYDHIKPMLYGRHGTDETEIWVRFLDEEPRSDRLFTTLYDSETFVGKVIIITETVVVVEVKVNHFNFLEKNLMTTIPAVGDIIEVIPYRRKQLTDQLIGVPLHETTQFMDGTLIQANCSEESYFSRIPGAKVTDPVLVDLIDRLQTSYIYDRYLCATHLLADIGAKDFRVENQLSTDDKKPSLIFSVHSSKFKGEISIIFSGLPKSYSIVFDGDEFKQLNHCFLDGISHTLRDNLDDKWQQITIFILEKFQGKDLNSHLIRGKYYV